MRPDRFRPWRLIGGTVSAVLLMVVFGDIFGLVNATPPRSWSSSS